MADGGSLRRPSVTKKSGRKRNRFFPSIIIRRRRRHTSESREKKKEVLEAKNVCKALREYHTSGGGGHVSDHFDGDGKQNFESSI